MFRFSNNRRVTRFLPRLKNAAENQIPMIQLSKSELFPAHFHFFEKSFNPHRYFIACLVIILAAGRYIPQDPVGTFAAISFGKSQKVTTRATPATSSRDKSFGFASPGIKPSAVRPCRTLGRISSSGSVPRESARILRFISCAGLLKCAAATTLFAEPCSQTKSTTDSLFSLI